MAKSLLTDTRIKALKASPGTREEHADSLVEGLRLRVTSTSKTWALRLRAGGKVRTITLGEYGDKGRGLGLASARTEAIKLKESISEGAVPRPVAVRRRRDSSNSVRSLVDRFQHEYVTERGVKRPDAYRWMFDKYVLPRLGDHDVTQLARADLREAVREIREQHGLTTARRVGGLLKRFFRWLASEDVIEADPAAALVLPGKEQQRDRTLTEAEIVAMWKATDAVNKPHERNKAGRIKPHPSDYPWGAYFRLLLLVGQRRSEVATMRWSAIDLEAGTWALKAADVKSARAHLVPLPAPAVALLKALPRITLLDEEGKEQPSDWVLTTNGRAPIADFSKPKRRLDEAMKRELETEELPHWQVHDLRRTVSTNLARLGIDPFARRRVLNHALTGVDAIYDQYDYLEPKRLALNAWAADLQRIISGERAPTNVVSLHG
jgi:integrase